MRLAEAFVELKTTGRERLNRTLQGVRSQLSRTVAVAGRLGSALTKAFSITGAGGLLAGGAGIGFGIKLAAEAEQAKVAFTTIIGDAEAAQKTLDDLRKFAASTPFQMAGLTQASRQLLAFGESHETLLDTLRNIGDVAAGVGAPIQEIAEIYGKARVQGRLFAEDINQLTGRGIPIIGELAKQFGVAESEVKKLTEQGKVNFSNLEQAFQSLTATGGRFAGLMAAQSQTLSGIWSTMKDSISENLRAIAETLIETFDFKAVLQGLTTGMQAVNTVIRSFGETFKDAFKVDVDPTAIAEGFLNLAETITEAFAGFFNFFDQGILKMEIAMNRIQNKWELLKTLNPGNLINNAKALLSGRNVKGSNFTNADKLDHELKVLQSRLEKAQRGGASFGGMKEMFDRLRSNMGTGAAAGGAPREMGAGGIGNLGFGMLFEGAAALASSQDLKRQMITMGRQAALGAAMGGLFGATTLGIEGAAKNVRGGKGIRPPRISTADDRVRFESGLQMMARIQSQVTGNRTEEQQLEVQRGMDEKLGDLVEVARENAGVVFT